MEIDVNINGTNQKFVCLNDEFSKAWNPVDYSPRQWLEKNHTTILEISKQIGCDARLLYGSALQLCKENIIQSPAKPFIYFAHEKIGELYSKFLDELKKQREIQKALLNEKKTKPAKKKRTPQKRIVQGQSQVTIEKQRIYKKLLTKQYLIIKNIVQKNIENFRCKVVHFDINAGSGYDEEGNRGSPFVFLESIRNNPIQSQLKCFFIEKDKELHRQLENNVGNFLKSNPYLCDPLIIRGNNENVLSMICDDLKNEYKQYRNRIFGTLYHDPNGYPNINAISAISSSPFFRQVDILININSLAIKRIRKCASMPEEKHNVDLIKLTKRINRPSKLISLPFQSEQKNTQWDFCFMLFTGWDKYPDDKKNNLFKIDSDEGQAILYHINYTEEEKKNDQSEQSKIHKENYKKLVLDATRQKGLI